mgnify:CR=1 FL=1
MSEQSVRNGYVQTQGVPLYYQLAGKGTPVLLLHAGVADSRMWAAQLAQPPDDLLLIAPDLKGYGRSPLPPGLFAYEDDLVALLDALELETAWIAGISCVLALVATIYPSLRAAAVKPAEALRYE